ncbi:hypothetical protein LZ554_002797 [Drepanopeziza brunnea f. sp. 'monogermtubi']|nr:hypothetical protein LZ554_002797 [Drepanopeziza brunnea f. sp. 'monogermtubi']
MPSGGCFCNKVRVEFNGEPDAHILCHCQDCRKMGGASYSNNVMIGEDKFKVQGTTKEYSKIADSGNKITSYFCPDCGTTVYRAGASFPNAVIIKVGILDGDWVEKNPPKGELYAAKRLKWVAAVEGAAQVNAMS